jgi:hypothetical protein
MIAGTESFDPVNIRTDLNAYPSEPGEIITSLAINPQMMMATRLAKIAENYERWYPRKVVLEFVPQGSALDVGALISIPVMDPADNFTEAIGLDSIRRALAYKNALAFNIFDKPHHVFPESDYDEPYLILPGQDARLEISHVWYLMAQSSFPARSSETERIIGWFKIHYEIELYEPRIPSIVSLPIYNFQVTNAAITTLFGTDTAVNDLLIGSRSLFGFDTLSNHFARMQLTTDLVGSVDGIIITSDGSKQITWRAGTVLYARLVVELNPQYCVFFTNLSHAFASNNALQWDVTMGPTNLITGKAILYELAVTA